MQNSSFLPQQWLKPSPVLTEPTHGRMARLSGPEVTCINTGIINQPKGVTNPSTNRASRSLTLLMWQTPSLLSQTNHTKKTMSFQNRYENIRINSLPRSFRYTTPTLGQFRRRLKTLLFHLAYGHDLTAHVWLSRLLEQCTINVRTEKNWMQEHKCNFT